MFRIHDSVAFRPKRVALAEALMLLLAGSFSLFSQLSSGSINGMITDPNHSAVANAEVIIENEATSGMRKTTTGSDGRYTVTQLQPGSYIIDVSAPGFQTYRVSNISLEASQNLEYNISLSLGMVSQKINVVGTAPVLDTQDANNAVTLTGQEAVALPIPTHNALGPIWTQTGVVAVRTGPTSDPAEGDQNMSRIALNGGRDESTAILVDGVSVTAGDWGGAMGIPSIESVQEFQVLRNTYDVQYGKTDGGVVSLITKSGSNHFHGSAFEYLRNDVLNANTWTNDLSGQPKTPYRFNQFGGSLGGPVLRRKRLFFFGSYDGFRQGQPDSLLTTVPTALQRQGDFSQTFNPDGSLARIFNPFSTVRSESGYTRTAFPNNKIPADLLNSSGLKTVNLYPMPNRPGNAVTGANNFAASGVDVTSYDRMDLRVDWALNDQWSLFGSVGRLWSNSTVSTLLGPGIDNTFAGPNTTWRALLSATYTPSPTWVINFVAAANTWNQEELSPSLAAHVNGSAYGLPQSLLDQLAAPTIPTLSIENYSSIGFDSLLLYLQHSNDAQVNLSKQWGDHLLKFGYQMQVQQMNENGQSPATFNFNRGLTSGPDAAIDSSVSGNGIASLLLGTMSSGSAVNKLEPAVTKKYLAWYLEDSWKVNSRLTLNYGLRYEIQTPLTERYNRQNYFDYTAINPLSQATGLNLQGGLVYSSSSDRDYWNADYTNLAPRVGIALNLIHNLVFRTGYGIYYSPTNTAAAGNADGYSITNTALTTQSNAGFIPANLFNNPFPNGLAPATGNSLGLLQDVGNSVNAWDRNHPTPYVQSYSADLQYQLSRYSMIDVGYQGTQGRKLPLGYRAFNINQLSPSYLSLGSELNASVANPFYGVIKAGPLSGQTIPYYQLLLPYPQFTSVNLPNDYIGASSSYNALNIKFAKRFSQGITALVSYSWSKAIDDTSETQGWEIGDAPRNTYDISKERSISAHDVPQYFVASLVWDLPVGRGRAVGGNMNKVANAVIGGWQVSTIVSLYSGLPLQFSCPNTLSAYGFQACRPNITSLDALSDVTRSLQQWFNTSPSVVSAPPAYTIGTAPRYISNERFGVTHNASLTLRKDFTIREQLKVGIHASAYNLSNTPVYGRANTTVGSLTFGEVTGLAPGGISRTVELGARITF